MMRERISAEELRYWNHGLGSENSGSAATAGSFVVGIGIRLTYVRVF